MSRYTEFIEQNPELCPGMDLVDYMWRTHTAQVALKNPANWKEIVTNREHLFRALKGFPEQGPTFEDASVVYILIGGLLSDKDRENKYVKEGCRGSYLFEPQGDDLFCDMVAQHIIKDVPEDRLHTAIKNAALKTVRPNTIPNTGPNTGYWMDAVYSELSAGQRQRIKENYQSWSDRESLKREIALEYIAQSYDEESMILKDPRFDFGKYDCIQPNDGCHIVACTKKQFGE